jgi:transcriptional regulator with XRE-family HTH domain
VAELRQLRRLSVRDLAALLEKQGTRMLPSAISKIENGQRDVRAEELVSLAIALNVSPNRLLLPGDSGESVVLPNGRKCSGQAVWRWAAGEQPLLGDEEKETPVTSPKVHEFIRENRPFEHSTRRELGRWLVSRVQVPVTAYIEADSAGRAKTRITWSGGDEENVDDGR